MTEVKQEKSTMTEVKLCMTEVKQEKSTMTEVKLCMTEVKLKVMTEMKLSEGNYDRIEMISKNYDRTETKL